MKAPNNPRSKALPSRVDWQRHWSQLFDTSERDAAINAIVIAFYWLQDDEDSRRRGRHSASEFATHFEDLVVKPLTQYISDIGLDVKSRGDSGATEGQRAAYALIKAILDTSEAMTSYKLGLARVGGLIADLKAKWDAFIIAGASCRMYWDIPLELERKKRQGEGGKKGAAARTKINPAELDKKRAGLASSSSLTTRQHAGRLATIFGVTPDAIRKAKKKAILK